MSFERPNGYHAEPLSCLALGANSLTRFLTVVCACWLYYDGLPITVGVPVPRYT